MDRQLIPRVLLALLVVLSLYAIKASLDSHTASGNRPKAFGAPDFGFAGYTDLTTTTQISAQWRVPRIAPTSIEGAASTWIAAESFDGHFIQLGTTENVDDFQDSYSVFWSDPIVHFGPQSLGSVRPGNLISYSMTKTSAGWLLRFDDHTTSKSKEVTIHYGRSTSFNEGQWTQEDPTFRTFGVHVPYPNMTLTHFSHLRINRQNPHLRFDDALAMSTPNGVTLIPSKVRKNQFTFHHAVGAARQYLQDDVSLAAAQFPFDNDAQDNITPTPLVNLGLLNALRNFVTNLKAQSWPKATHVDIAGIVKNEQRMEKLVRHWPVALSPLPPQEYNKLLNLKSTIRLFTFDLSSRLNLPPPG